jgi:flavin reductase (DIM6/NTAB) family NADH-FMN oxidoreductase RutF
MVAPVTEVEATVNRWVGEIDYPMLIITAGAGGERAGCLVGFWTQCSIDPLRFLVCLSDKNRTYRVAQDAELLAVHLVPADREDLVELFGSQTGDDVDKFARAEWHEGPGGTPVLDGCPNRFVGLILDRFDVGDHQAQLLEPVEAAAGADVRQFPFHRAKRLEPGHEA